MHLLEDHMVQHLLEDHMVQHLLEDHMVQHLLEDHMVQHLLEDHMVQHLLEDHMVAWISWVLKIVAQESGRARVGLISKKLNSCGIYNPSKTRQIYVHLKCASFKQCHVRGATGQQVSTSIHKSSPSFTSSCVTREIGISLTKTK